MSNWLCVLIWFVAILPLETFLHELGHGLTALACGAERSTIWMGDKSPKKALFVWRRRRLQVVWGKVLSGGFGWASYERQEPMTRRQRVFILLGGPAVTLFLLIPAIVLNFMTEDNTLRFLLQLTASGLAGTLFFTMIPMRYPAWMGAYAGQTSDMKKVVDLWNESRTQ